MAASKPSIRTRLARRRNQLRAALAVARKRSATVNKRKAQQKHARKNLDSAVKHHRPKHELDALQAKLADAHRLLDKALVGQKEAEAHARAIQKKVEWLKKHVPPPAKAPAAGGVSTPNAPWNPGHRQISNSLIPWLIKSYNAGWRGYVTSGYRSASYQCEVCKGVCGNCGGCPGRCAAPGTSNHGRYGPGQGAVDVTDYYTFGAIQRRIGSPLHNYLGAQDPVHFSFTGR